MFSNKMYFFLYEKVKVIIFLLILFDIFPSFRVFFYFSNVFHLSLAMLSNFWWRASIVFGFKGEHYAVLKKNSTSNNNF